MATVKQKLAFNKIVENHGNVSKTMREVGYSENSAKNPSNLIESTGWQELMDEYIPDRSLAEKHRALLNKVDAEGNIDVQAVKAALDMGYKLKGSYAAEKSLNLNLNVDKTSNTDLDALAEAMANKLKEEKI